MAAVVNCFCCVGGQVAARTVSDENGEQVQAPAAETHRANAQDLGERRTSVLGEVLFGSRASVQGGVPAQAAGHAAPGQVAPVVVQARDGGERRRAEDDDGAKRDPVGWEALFTARGIKVVAVTSVVTIDTTSDIALGVVQAASGDTRGFWTLGIVASSLVAQAYAARINGEDELNQFLAIVGVKPAVDAYRVVFDVPKPEGVIASNQQMLVYSRMVEATTESFFQVLLQVAGVSARVAAGTALFGTPGDTLQVVSLCISLISLGYSMADSSISLDLDPEQRQRLPSMNGWVRTVLTYLPTCVAPAYYPALTLALAAFQTCHLLNTSLGVTTWAAVNPVGCAGALAAGMPLLVVVHFFAQGGRLGHCDRLQSWWSTLMNDCAFYLAYYLSIWAVPLPALRVSNFLTGQVYFLSLLCTSAASGAMVLLSATSSTGSAGDMAAVLTALGSNPVATIWAVSCAVEWLSFAAIVAMTAPEYRWSWVWSMSEAERVRTVAWNNPLAESWKWDEPNLADADLAAANQLFIIFEKKLSVHPPKDDVVNALKPAFIRWAAKSEGERYKFCFLEDVIKRLREDGYDELANIVAVPAPIVEEENEV